LIFIVIVNSIVSIEVKKLIGLIPPHIPCMEILGYPKCLSNIPYMAILGYPECLSNLPYIEDKVYFLNMMLTQIHVRHVVPISLFQIAPVGLSVV
jgi:hypothetical protein